MSATSYSYYAASVTNDASWQETWYYNSRPIDKQNPSTYVYFLFSGTDWYWANYASRFSTCAVQKLSVAMARILATTWPSLLSGLTIQTTNLKLDPVSSVVASPDNNKYPHSEDRCIWKMTTAQILRQSSKAKKENCNSAVGLFLSSKAPSNASVFALITQKTGAWN